ncbi:MAG: hypothetical protein LBK99_24515 [Opitutaceae bacterium]|jgi:hypothetical protein|nr:hypothetical protein [Opitutaceae bacterium]
MKWITLAAADLNDYLVALQMTSLRTAVLATGQADPFVQVAADVISKVRAYIASNPDNRVSATPLTIPPELRTDTCYLIIAPLMGRLKLKLNEDQRKALDIAHSTLIALREKKLLVSKPDDPVEPEVQGACDSVEQASRGPRRFTQKSLSSL